MKVRFQADNDFDRRVITGLLRKEPAIDFQTAQEARLDGVPDPLVLRRAADEERVVVTHDVATMRTHFLRVLASGAHSSGLIVLPQSTPIGRAIDGLLHVWTNETAEEWIDCCRWIK